MKKISVYTRSGVTSPSSYYRILQYVDKIPGKVKCRIVVPEMIYNNYNKSQGLKRKLYQFLYYFFAYIRVNYYLLSDILRKPDVVFISRAIMPRIIFFPTAKLMRVLFANCHNVIWDIDDNIFGSKEITNTEKNILLRYTDRIIVLGDYLKSLIPERYHSKIVYLPTTDGDYADKSIEEFMEQRKSRYDAGEVGLLWLATYTSLPFVEDIIPYIDEAAEKILFESGKQLVLEIVCNRPLQISTKFLKVANYTWSKEMAHSRICESHIGIMPLRYTEQTLGKGGFKLVQYMSVGLATIGSAVGYSNEIINNDVTGKLVSYSDLTEWEKALVSMSSSWDTLSKMGKNARIRWEKDFSFDANLKKLNMMLCEAEEDEEKRFKK